LGIERGNERLTGDALGLLGNVLFVSAGCGADGFVGCGEGYDGEEGEEEAASRSDVPPLEHDAEVRRVPGKQHLSCKCQLQLADEGSTPGFLLTFILHIGISPPISPCPISPCPIPE